MNMKILFAMDLMGLTRFASQFIMDQASYYEWLFLLKTINLILY